MDIHSFRHQKYYLITGGCALLSLFSCIFLPFVKVSNETSLSSHPLIFTTMELTGSNVLNIILSIGMLVVVAKFTLLQALFTFKEIPLATQEYWAKRTLVIMALLGLLVNIWAFFDIKQIFDAYSQTENLYSTKPMTGCWLILFSMAAVVVSNMLNRIPAPAKNSSEPANTPIQAKSPITVERHNTPQNPTGNTPQQKMPANYPMPQAPAVGYNVGPQMPSSRPMPAQTNQPPVQQRPVNPPAPMPMHQPAPQQRSTNQPAAPQPSNPSPLQQRPFSLPALPQTPPIQPAIQQKPVNPPPAAPQPAKSIVPQGPFSLPALPPAPPAAQQKQLNAPVFPLPVGQPIKQQRPFSLPGLPQTPPTQPAVQQKPANPPVAPQPVGLPIMQQRSFSLPALPSAAPINSMASNVQPQAQSGNPTGAQQNKPKDAKSQFMKPPPQM